MLTLALHHHCSFRSQDSGPKPGPEIQDRNIFFDPKMWDRDSVLNLETQIFSVLNSRTEALLTMEIFLGGGGQKNFHGGNLLFLLFILLGLNVCSI